MADPQKGISTADSKKKSPSLDEDFGKDFLSSWKPLKTGKDAIDFHAETVPRNKKLSFKFDDKLDDFELSGDFGNFKMDMPDLDFSSPVKKTEKPKENSSKELALGKHESKQEKFSFNFDFNELARFDLDSSPLKGKKKSSKCTDGTAPDCSFKRVRKQDSRSNSVTSTDVFEDQETKKPLNSDSMDTLRPDNLIEPSIAKGAKPSIFPDHENQDVSCEAQTSTVKQITVAEENKSETHSSEGQREQSNGRSLTKPYAEKANQDFSLQSVSGDCSAHEDLPQYRTGLASLNAVKAGSAREQDNSMRSVDSSQSRNASPETSYNSRCCPETSIVESPNTSGEFQKHHQGNEATGGKAVLSKFTQGQKESGNGSFTNSLQKIAHRMNNTGDKENSGSELIPSLLQRDSRTVKPMPVKETAISALQFKSLNKSAENVSRTTSALTPKQLDSIDRRKLKTMIICPANENRESKQNHEQAENQKVDMLKSYEKGSTKGISVISGSERNDVHSNTSSFQLKIFNLPQQTTASNAAKCINFVSSTASIKSSKLIPVEVNATSLKDDKTCDISRLTISRITKLESKTPNSATPKEAKSVRFSERNLEFPLTTASKMGNSVITEKCASLSTPLKRKTLEESTADPETLNPLKRVMESSTGNRKSFEVSPKIEREVFSGTEISEACHNDNYAENLASNVVPEVGSLADVEVPILIEKDGNIEKAEACAKELDDICNMLKKKHEEAKELLVRAIVNNNTLLMLNHPMFEEKIRGLHRFATSLGSKEF